MGTQIELVKGFKQGDKFLSPRTKNVWEVVEVSPVKKADRHKLLRCINQHGQVKDYLPRVLKGMKNSVKTVKPATKKAHPYYAVYSSMKTRCYNKNCKPYRWYGARGITVCERWLQDFWNFVEDLGDRPDGYTLERLDNSKGYSPENCVWASVQENNKNRRPNSGWSKECQGHK
jgi:hypothetical protein